MPGGSDASQHADPDAPEWRGFEETRLGGGGRSAFFVLIFLATCACLLTARSCSPGTGHGRGKHGRAARYARLPQGSGEGEGGDIEMAAGTTARRR